MNLVGQNPVTLEDEKLLTVPDQYLRVLGRRLALSASEEGNCLCEIWSADELDDEDQVVLVEADESGRVEIPARFLEDANDSGFMLCGIWDHLELWDTKAWDEFCARSSVDELLGLKASAE